MENRRTEDILKSIYDSLTDEQKAKAKSCRNAEELIKLAESEGIELPDEVLDSVAGGVRFAVGQVPKFLTC